MAKRAGSLFWCEIQVASTWVMVPGQRTTAGKINNEQVDVTEKGAVPWRGLAACGIRSAEISMAGVPSDKVDTSLWNTMLTSVMAGSIIQARLVSNGLDVIVEGAYLVQAMEENGEFNGAMLYTITLASAGSAGFDTVSIITESSADLLTEAGDLLLVEG